METSREIRSSWRTAVALGSAAWVAVYVLLLVAVPEQVARFLGTNRVAALLGILMITALLASVVAVEGARRYVVPRARWTNQGHLAAVVLAWIPFAILTTGYWWLRCGLLSSQ